MRRMTEGKVGDVWFIDVWSSALLLWNPWSRLADVHSYAINERLGCVQRTPKLHTFTSAGETGVRRVSGDSGASLYTSRICPHILLQPLLPYFSHSTAFIETLAGLQECLRCLWVLVFVLRPIHDAFHSRRWLSMSKFRLPGWSVWVTGTVWLFPGLMSISLYAMGGCFVDVKFISFLWKWFCTDMN